MNKKQVSQLIYHSLIKQKNQNISQTASAVGSRIHLKFNKNSYFFSSLLRSYIHRSEQGS